MTTLDRFAMGRSRRLAAAVLVLAGLVVGACGDDDDTATEQQAPVTTGATETTAGVTTTQAPKRGGTYTHVTQIDAAVAFDPANFSSALGVSDGAQAAAIFDWLLYVDMDEVKAKPWIAESITSTDAVTWTLKIRRDVKFSDGTPYDAAAVKFNWERMLDPALRSPSFPIVSTMQSLDVVDPLTLRITLKEPNGQLPFVIASRIPFIGSPTAIRAGLEQFRQNPIGAGPFVFKEWVRDSQLTLERNPTYWRAPEPYLDRIVFQIIPDPFQRYNTMQAGQSHSMNSIGDFRTYIQARKDGFQLLDQPLYVGGSGLVFNMTRPPFDDIRARKALQHAVDHKKILDVLYEGNGQSPDYIFRPPSPFHDPSLKLPEFNATEAQRLLDEYAAAHGKPLEFTMKSSASYRNVLEFLQGEWGRFRNLDAKVEIIPSTVVLSTIAQKDFDAFTFPTSGYDPEPQFYEHYHTGAGRNWMGYSNPEVDRALERGRASLDENVRKEAYRTLQRHVIEDAPEVWMAVGTGGVPGGGFILAKSVRGARQAEGGLFWGQIWIDS